MAKIITRIKDMQQFIYSLPKKSSIGFVPTMGCLHQGHLSLVGRSIQENEVTVISIFVNPAQFGINEDFNTYPRDFGQDQQSLANYAVDVIFAPDVDEMFPEGFSTYIEVGKLSSMFCGKSRPGHFRGVSTVVNKLLNIVSPHTMYMGEKDYQQILVLEKMIQDLNYSTKIVRCPLVREIDGLALSSRNRYLSKRERKQATCLSKSLFLARKLGQQGYQLETIKEEMKKIINQNKGLIDYLEFVNSNTFSLEKEITSATRVIIAVKIGKTRLIDNISIYE